MLLNVEGIVLRQIKYHEWDKILTIYTRENGKIQAIAKGARRQKSPLISCSQVFSYSRFILYKGKNFYYINSGEIVDTFYSLREDIYKLAYATYFLELVDCATFEEYPIPILFDLLIKTLRVLENLKDNYSKLARAFELKYISFIGYKPNLKTCVLCNNEPGNNIIFSIKNGGILCEDCKQKDNEGYIISKDILKAMRFLMYTELDKLDKMIIDDNTMVKLKEIIINYLKEYTDRESFKSLDFLNSIKE
ncbi:DNA repair protein RecO [Caloranaerobacter azorensis H53214]|uniref:DNA repair protein RecO n=1 Tax=Caloranaerobacter azorensis H53214 TaxID=1156417 RepID=A0A096DLK8_9FIRM|nr:DNA repair protein RecO [Caloranaerobacter azorensis]KGG80161.1 DNA repair protein RecO [Caloranaerobacter azorensis H53214]